MDHSEPEQIEAFAIQPSEPAPTLRPAPIMAATPATAPVTTQDSLHGARTEEAPQRLSVPVFMVRTRDGETGRLIVDRRAERDGWALVELDGAMEEIDPAELIFDRIE